MAAAGEDGVCRARRGTHQGGVSEVFVAELLRNERGGAPHGAVRGVRGGAGCEGASRRVLGAWRHSKRVKQVLKMQKKQFENAGKWLLEV